MKISSYFVLRALGKTEYVIGQSIIGRKEGTHLPSSSCKMSLIIPLAQKFTFFKIGHKSQYGLVLLN